MTTNNKEKMGNGTYQICNSCVMDTTAPKITFDKNGICEYCNNYKNKILKIWSPNEDRSELLYPLIDKIKKETANKSHHCIMGVSGGADSSYLAHIAKEKYGLNPLMFHVDAGWNSAISVSNIEKLVEGLGLDLHTVVINWKEMQDLQLAFFRAQVPHLDAPQDHAYFASLYNFAVNNGFKYILTGGNYSTEFIREPLDWIYHASDLRQLKDIHRIYGKRRLGTYPTADILKYKIYYRFAKGLKVIKPLDYSPYIINDAVDELREKYAWKKFKHKHYESRFTKFFEGYWLPKKFGYDKRKTHFSSLIITGQMTREEAMAELTQPAYNQDDMEKDFEFVAKKLGLSTEELKEIMSGENKTYKHYKNKKFIIDIGVKFMNAFGNNVQIYK